MSLARKNEEVAANLQESEEAAANLQEAKDLKNLKNLRNGEDAIGCTANAMLITGALNHISIWKYLLLPLSQARFHPCYLPDFVRVLR